jgi:hypothetical protein
MAQKIRPQIRKFVEAADALRDGTTNYFSITKLTSLKTLCKNHQTAIAFVAYLAENTYQRIRVGTCPKYTDPADSIRYQEFANKAIQIIHKYLEDPNSIDPLGLREICREAEAVQVYKSKEMWGHPIRTIYSVEVLVIEDALRCIMEPVNAPYWAYQTARDYTERYNSRSGTGLIPESLPMLDDIIKFWLECE